MYLQETKVRQILKRVLSNTCDPIGIQQSGNLFAKTKQISSIRMFWSELMPKWQFVPWHLHKFSRDESTQRSTVMQDISLILIGCVQRPSVWIFMPHAGGATKN